MLQLITAAEDVFLNKGYHCATMNDVAKAAGMSKKTVYQLIASKQDLFAALLEHQQSLMKPPVPDPTASLRDILVQNLLSLAHLLFYEKQIALVRLIMAEHTHSPDLGRVFHRRRVAKTRNRLELGLLAVAPYKLLKPSEIREMSAMLFGMALGEFHLSVLVGFRPAPSQAALKRRVTRAVDLFLLEKRFFCRTSAPEMRAPAS